MWRDWFQHWISQFCDRIAQIRWNSSNSNHGNMLYISNIFLLRYILINMTNNPFNWNMEYSNYVCPYIGFICPYLPLHTSSPASKYEKMNQWWCNAGPALQTLYQHYYIIESTSRVSWASLVVCKQWICILVYTGAPTPEVPRGRRQ